MHWSEQRALTVPADVASARLGVAGSGWLLPFLQLAAGGPAGDHWYRFRPSTSAGRARLVWRPPLHPTRFRRFRGHLAVRAGPPAVLVLTGETDGGTGDEEVDGRTLRTLLEVLGAAFDGLGDGAPEDHPDG